MLLPQVVLDYDDEDVSEDDAGYPSLYIGPTLRAMRLRARVSQSEIARRLDVDSSIPSRWEGFDSQHGGRSTTRYKRVPGKYLPQLATLLSCGLGELAPELAGLEETPLTGVLAGTTVSYSNGGLVTYLNSTSALTTFTGTASVTTGSSSYVDMGTPSPVPGRPPRELGWGHWRRRCPGCRKTFIETLDGERAPRVCDACNAPVRAATTVRMILHAPPL